MNELPIKFNYYIFFILGVMACLILMQPHEVITNVAMFFLLTWVYLAWALYELTHVKNKKKAKKD